MATPIESALRKAVADLNTLKLRWALIGGLAISARSAPRFTKDLDFAVAVGGDAEAEGVVLRLQGRGYRTLQVLEPSRTTSSDCQGSGWRRTDPML